MPRGHAGAASPEEIKTWLNGYGRFLQTGLGVVHDPHNFPDAKIITFGMAHSGCYRADEAFPDPRRFVAMLRNVDGVDDLKGVDGYGTHLYPSPNDIEDLVRHTLGEDAALGQDKPIWITEWGFLEVRAFPNPKRSDTAAVLADVSPCPRHTARQSQNVSGPAMFYRYRCSADASSRKPAARPTCFPPTPLPRPGRSDPAAERKPCELATNDSPIGLSSGGDAYGANRVHRPPAIACRLCRSMEASCRPPRGCWHGANRRRCGVPYVIVGGRKRADRRRFVPRIHGPRSTGEDKVIQCVACGYAANQERAEIGAHDKKRLLNGPRKHPLTRPSPTPNKKTIRDVCRVSLECQRQRRASCSSIWPKANPWPHS